MNSAYTDALKHHYSSIWENSFVERHWNLGPVTELPPNFTVLEFAPMARRGAWTYATSGMSEPADEMPIELHLFSPRQSERHIELLTAICHFHRTCDFLDIGHTVNFGRPWLDESLCTCGLISLPYLDGPVIEEFRFAGKLTRCLWLIPITLPERDFKKFKGVEALEQLFERVRFNYLDPKRSSLI